MSEATNSEERTNQNTIKEEEPQQEPEQAANFPLDEETSADIYNFFRLNRGQFHFVHSADDGNNSKNSPLRDDEDIDVFMTIPPDGGWGWIIVAVGFLCCAIVDGMIYAIGRILPVISKDLQIHVGKTTLISAIQSGVYFMIGPVVSAIVNKFGFRVVAISGSIIGSVGILLGSFCSSWQLLVLTYGFVTGCGFGMIYSPSILIVGYYFEKYRAIATGIAICGSGFGALVMSPLMDYFTATFGWRTTLQIQSGICGFCALITILYRPIQPTKVLKLVDKVNDSDSNSETSVEVNFAHYSKYFPSKPTTIFSENNSINSSQARKLVINEITTKGEVFNVEHNLKEYHENHKFLCKCCTNFSCCGKQKELTERLEPSKIRYLLETHPLDRNDIFFSASLLLLPEYRERTKKITSLVEIMQNKDNVPSLNYILSITRLPPSGRNLEPPNKCRISPVIMKALNVLFDFSVLNIRSFQVLLLVSFLIVFGNGIPYLFVTDRADLHNINHKYSNWFISVIGLSNSICRIFAGLLSFLVKTDPAYICGFAIIMSGTIILLSGFLGQNSTAFQFIFCVIYGSGSAFYPTLRPVIFVNCVGLEKLTNAFGLISLVMGFATIIGTSFGGWLKEITGNYNLTFLFAGTTIILGGILESFVPYIIKLEKKKRKVRFAEDT